MNAVSWQVSFGEGALVDRLLEEGLTLYGQNRTAEAVHCWRRVLAMVPDEARALEYLECAGVPPVAAAPSQTHVMPPALRATHAPFEVGEATSLERQALEALLRQRRFEEAFELLYRARDPGALLAAAPRPPASDPGPTSPPASVDPPTERAPPPPAAEPGADALEALFARATEAYLTRDYREAERLYEECLAVRPDDWRVQNNLKKLRSRPPS